MTNHILTNRYFPCYNVFVGRENPRLEDKQMMTEIAEKLKELGIELTEENAWALTEVIIKTMEQIDKEI